MVDSLANPYSVVTPAAKGVRLSELPPEAWQYLRGGSGAGDLAKFHRAVPWLFRGVDLRADAVADMPFVVLRGRGQDAQEVDNSKDWQNAVGFLPHPRDLLWLVEAALVVWGYCYLEQGRTVARRLRELRYLWPTTVQPEIDPERGLTGFQRRGGPGSPMLRVQDVASGRRTRSSRAAAVPPAQSARGGGGALQRR